MRLTRPSALIVTLALVASAPVVAQPRPAASNDQSAAISDVRYDVTFDATTARTRTLKVAMTFAVDGQGAVLLSLPAWTPGAYEISNFAKYISNFDAKSGNRSLDWDKLDHDSWRIRPNGARSVTVTFDYVAESLDNAMSWATREFALFNGTNIFFHAEGRPLEFASTVTVHTDPAWKIATGMRPGAAARSYTAANFHDLVDMPFFVGRFDLDSARIADRWVRLASWPAGALTGKPREEFWEHHRKMIPPQIAVFGETPFDSYTTMIMFDSTSGGGSALEHQNSHVGIYSPLLVGSVLFPSITAHEIFHAWNVKRLRPADMVPYRYDRPQPTTWLWVSEGITDYYADLSLVRGGIIDSTGFLLLTQGKLGEVQSTRPVALEDASLSTWIGPVDGSGYIYYQKGSLAGLMLDIMIRDASDNRGSLDDVMRELYRTTFKQGRGFTGEQWWAAVSRAANGKSFADFNERYIDGREPYPWSTVLPLAGMRFDVDTIHEPRIGVQTLPDSAGVRVVAVEPGSAAAAAGILEGDYLLRVDDIEVADPSFGDEYRRTVAGRAGATVPVRVRRGEQEVALRLQVRTAGRVEQRLIADPNASPKAIRIRAGIMKGTTDR